MVSERVHLEGRLADGDLAFRLKHDDSADWTEDGCFVTFELEGEEGAVKSVGPIRYLNSDHPTPGDVVTHVDLDGEWTISRMAHKVGPRWMIQGDCP